jgi:phage tail-like protein
MDSQGTHFLLLTGPADLDTGADGLAWDAAAGGFGLVQDQALHLPAVDAAEALVRWAAAEPLVLDAHGQLGRLSPDRRTFELALDWPPREWRPVRAQAVDASAAGAEALALDPVDAPPGTAFTDVHLGGDALAALPFSEGAAVHGLTLIHLRERWQARCDLPEAPLRAWIDGADRVWVLTARALLLCRGRPLPHPYRPRPERFEPLELDPDRLRLRGTHPLPPNAGVLALAGEGRRLLVLARTPGEDSSAQQVMAFDPEAADGARWTVHPVEAQVPFATDLAPVDGDRLALLAPRAPGDAACRACDCPVVVLDGAPAPRARLIRERYPMHSQAAVRFVRGADGQARYLAEDRPRGLHRLPQARFPAAARGVLRRRLDSGEPGTLWHRLFLEACIPAGCRVRVETRVSEDWDARTEAGWDPQPVPAWVPRPSELPWDLGRIDPIPGRQGLFEILLQRPSGAVRELRGRYLELRLSLSGDGRHSPRIRAIRVWYPRFSWQQAYLPEHFHQQERPPPATLDPALNPEPANGADVRERLLAAFEGLLTPLEERIAAAEVLLDPAATPTVRLPALAEMLGTRPPTHWPEARRRAWISVTGTLQRHRGTLAGLALALDVATDGAVGRGQVVPVESFRLRRTLGTVLGIDLSDEGHPLTLGTGQSGNSIIGESLILTDEEAAEVLALFAPELADTAAERAAAEGFFDRYARRLTVVLHGEARRRRATVESVLADEVPAQVQWVIRETDHPFVLGLSPLLGIDSFLTERPPFEPVVLDATRLGRGALLRNPAALAPEHARPGGAPDNPGDR